MWRIWGMGEVCTGFWSGNLKERDHWEDPDVDGRPEETTICYKISLVQLITNFNVILYLSTCHTVYISILILFMIMP